MATSASLPSLPATHRALVVRDTNVEPKVETVPVPAVLPGTAVLRVVAAPVLSYIKEIFIGNARQYKYPLPIVPGTSAICRVAAVGPDSTHLEVGQLVLFDCMIRARDTQAGGQEAFLCAVGHSAATTKLMTDGGFRDGTFAEHVRVPLENVFVLDEHRLFDPKTSGGLGLTPSNLGQFQAAIVPYGGLSSVNLRPGETVLVSPATGPFGGVACLVALAMGARVLAWGRNEETLAALRDRLETISDGRFRGMVKTLKLHNDRAKDAAAIAEAAAGKLIDVFFDISPPQASDSTHISTGIQALRHSGRVSLMGGLRGEVPLPLGLIMHMDITVKGKWMYTRDDIFGIIKLAETGLLKLGEDGGSTVLGEFGLDEWKAAWDLAATCKAGQSVVLKP
ncbi:chaperonin 10-like protein [Xylariales sp. PMI_506]|nr:chaperonin 10-like protein [Xylariales sp. PMI_506]